MRLKRLTGLERSKIEEELADLREKITWYQQVLGDMSLVLRIIKMNFRRSRINTTTRARPRFQI